MMHRISLTGFPPDDRDVLNILARRVAEEHFHLQASLLQFHLQADSGEHVTDGTYMRVLASLARMSLVGSELRSAILSFRTTAKMPTVPDGGDAI